MLVHFPIKPLKHHHLHHFLNHYFLLVFSQPGLSTRQVFEVFDESFPEGDLRARKADFAAGFDLGLAGRNSLLAPAQALRSDLAELMNAIPGQAKLSGSGPTLYLLSSDQGEMSKWQRSYEALGLQTLLTSFGAEGAGLI